MRIQFDPADFSAALLVHHHKHARPLPWRQNKDPYRIWLSEIMLQQTTVATVIPYFNAFLVHFPTVHDLAQADEQEVLHLWQGLGYYSRARNLLKCAVDVHKNHDGVFPRTAEKLAKLAGIGPYTSAAIASIAFGESATIVDGNVERVISRVFCIEAPLPLSKPCIKKYAQMLTPQQNAGDYAEAIMDLGATICTPKNPKCLLCPVKSFCKAVKSADPETWPRRQPKKKRPHKTGVAWLITDKNDRLYLQQRPDKGLLANLWELPSQGWEEKSLPAHIEAIIQKEKAENIGTIRHVFTHFSLALDIRHIKLKKAEPGWFTRKTLPPVPTLMRKALTTGLKKPV